jgi:hypothetical protein
MMAFVGRCRRGARAARNRAAPGGIGPPEAGRGLLRIGPPAGLPCNQPAAGLPGVFGRRRRRLIRPQTAGGGGAAAAWPVSAVRPGWAAAACFPAGIPGGRGRPEEAQLGVDLDKGSWLAGPPEALPAVGEDLGWGRGGLGGRGAFGPRGRRPGMADSESNQDACARGARGWRQVEQLSLSACVCVVVVVVVSRWVGLGGGRGGCAHRAERKRRGWPGQIRLLARHHTGSAASRRRLSMVDNINLLVDCCFCLDCVFTFFTSDYYYYPESAPSSGSCPLTLRAESRFGGVEVRFCLGRAAGLQSRPRQKQRHEARPGLEWMRIGA